MRKYLIILLLLIPSLVYGGALSGGAGLNYCPASSPTDGQYPQWVASTSCYQGSSGTSGAQTPWGSNIVAAGYKITGIGGGSTITGNGALSTGAGPAFLLNGTWVSGGSATTTKPYLLIEPSGTTS